MGWRVPVWCLMTCVCLPVPCISPVMTAPLLLKMWDFSSSHRAPQRSRCACSPCVFFCGCDWLSHVWLLKSFKYLWCLEKEDLSGWDDSSVHEVLALQASTLEVFHPWEHMEKLVGGPHCNPSAREADPWSSSAVSTAYLLGVSFKPVRKTLLFFKKKKTQC